jgi:uncharacterized protein (TIGR02246 family)
MSNDEKMIREVIATWLRASREGDTTTIAKLMTDDVVFLTPGNEPMIGRDAFLDRQRQLKDVRIDAHSDVREVWTEGDWGYAWSDLTVTMTKSDGTSTRRKGSTLSIFRRSAAGEWQIARDANMLASDKTANG